MKLSSSRSAPLYRATVWLVSAACAHDATDSATTDSVDTAEPSDELAPPRPVRVRWFCASPSPANFTVTITDAFDDEPRVVDYQTDTFAAVGPALFELRDALFSPVASVQVDIEATPEDASLQLFEDDANVWVDTWEVNGQNGIHAYAPERPVAGSGETTFYWHNYGREGVSAYFLDEYDKADEEWYTLNQRELATGIPSWQITTTTVHETLFGYWTTDDAGNPNPPHVLYERDGTPGLAPDAVLHECLLPNTRLAPAVFPALGNQE